MKSRYLTSLYSLFGFLQEEEAIAALWAAGYLEKQMMTEYLSKGGGLVTIDLHHLRRRVESTIIGETIKVSISLSGEGMLDENDTNLDLFKNTEIRVLEKEFNEMYLFASDVYCHHYIPLHLGGTDKFNNLRILHKEVQQLIHLTQNETIGVLKNRLGLTELMMSKINQYREKYALGPV
ncbi:Ger(x)C family spore germination C-terminal domain-containing protein [Paenibacillus sp. yr247]|uniref:Ger(x)C family spore germination C-terminal domain-containing protein n=1 Tax=Paenibacillus sp. yr247 TaxID=1761880 RepID=UPI000B8A356A|nr:Ger(x)C family spore germination C-terminal domain-containing protein [Paenibacillus sp. yr247]